MIVVDVNVLVYAFRQEAEQHAASLDWLTTQLTGGDGVGLTEAAVAGFIRVSTDSRIFTVPARASTAWGFVAWTERSSTTRWLPADRAVRTRFRTLVEDDPAIRGRLVPDAWLAATALAQGATVATADRGFARFPGLRLVDPTRSR